MRHKERITKLSQDHSDLMSDVIKYYLLCLDACYMGGYFIILFGCLWFQSNWWGGDKELLIEGIVLFIIEKYY